MDKEKVFIRIDEYIDGEIKQSEEESLFAELALDSEARKYLRSLTLLKQTGAGNSSEFPVNLEEKILMATTLKDFSVVRRNLPSKITRYISIGVSVILLIVSLFLYISVNQHRKEIITIVNKLEDQQELIKALYNTLPAAEVRATYSNEIIVKPNS